MSARSVELTLFPVYLRAVIPSDAALQSKTYNFAADLHSASLSSTTGYTSFCTFMVNFYHTNIFVAAIPCHYIDPKAADRMPTDL